MSEYFYKVHVEAAKSGKSTCKNCNKNIEDKTLRVKVVDARAFNAYIARHGRQNLSGQGLSRGYFQCVGPRGQNISIQKYFVHLNCYKAIEPHPYEKQYFDIKTLKPSQRQVFQQWLASKNKPKKSKKQIKPKSAPKKKAQKPTKQKKSKKPKQKKSQSKTKLIKKQPKTK